MKTKTKRTPAAAPASTPTQAKRRALRNIHEYVAPAPAKPSGGELDSHHDYVAPAHADPGV